VLTAAFLSVVAQAQSSKFEKVAPGVWFREGVPISRHPSRPDEMGNPNTILIDRPDEMGNPNTILIEMKEYLIVVDASYPSGARLMMEAANTVSPKPIQYVLVTHHHGDHSYGNAEWTKAGATTVAHIGVAEEMMRHEPASWRSAARWRKDVAAVSPAAPELPLRIFERSPFVLEDGARRVEMHHFGWAHTRGDSFVFLPKEKVICTGDAVVNGGFNDVGHGSIGNWNSVLAKARALGAKHVLPGHGRPGGAELFTGQMRFLTELQKAVRKEIDRGRKLEELVFADPKRDSAFLLGNPRTTVRLPASVRHWISVDRLPRQVSDAYAQLAPGIEAAAPPELISFPTEDGGIVYADLYGKGERGVVLAHGGRFNKATWEKQARTLAEAGFRIVAIDFRGRGQSRGGTRPRPDDDGLRFDVLAAVRYLRKTGARTVSVVGGSMGGGAAAEASVEATPGEIDGLVLLASEAGDKPEQTKGRKLFILARDDASGSGLRLPRIREHYERSPGPKELVILEGSAHAQFLFATEQGERLMREILRFLSEP
jgi:glyoxylase-like metal-dependent hydrolase (beta-lactamase superfamily II)/pimeloyl-ACP methyl ester carboxylesterase